LVSDFEWEVAVIKLLLLVLSFLNLSGFISSTNQRTDTCSNGNIVFTNYDLPNSLFFYDISTKQTSSLYIGRERIVMPSWSNDGKKIAYVSFIGEKSSIFSVSVDGKENEELTDYTSINLSPSWSKDDSTILFSSLETGKSQIYRVNIKTKEIQKLTDEDFSASFPSYSPDNNDITFTGTKEYDENIYIRRINSTNPSEKIKNAIGFAPKWSPNGESIAFLSEAWSSRGNYRIVIYDIKEKLLSLPITENKDDDKTLNIAYSNVLWSQNGNCLMFRISKNSSDYIGTFNIKSGEIMEIMDATNIPSFDWYSR
jgi:TolB protein